MHLYISIYLFRFRVSFEGGHLLHHHSSNHQRISFAQIKKEKKTCGENCPIKLRKRMAVRPEKAL
jgi:hypothetical protein